LRGAYLRLARLDDAELSDANLDGNYCGIITLPSSVFPRYGVAGRQMQRHIPQMRGCTEM
jgi:hypothetical protein